MRIAVAVTSSGRIAPHAGKACHWLVSEADGGMAMLSLDRAQLFHHWEGKPGEHPLEAMAVLVTASAGDGFVRRLARSGVRVCMTSETDPQAAIACLRQGCELPVARFNPLLLLCKVKDFLSAHR